MSENSCEYETAYAACAATEIGCVGMLMRLFEELKAFVRRTKRDGKPLGTIPWVRRAMADLDVRIEIGRQLGLLNAWLIDQGQVPTKEGSMSKVYVSDRVTDRQMAAVEALWCGARNGGSAISGCSGSTRPATEWMRVTSRACSSASGGRMPGSLRASIVLPVPGGP